MGGLGSQKTRLEIWPKSPKSFHMSATALLQLKQQLSRLTEKERQEVSAFLHRMKQETPA